MKAIALAPDDRFPTMDAMINALTRIQLARATRGRPPRARLVAAALTSVRGPAAGHARLPSSAPTSPVDSDARQSASAGAAQVSTTSSPAAAQPLARSPGRLALGLLLGGTLCHTVMTPTSPASAKASESAPVPSPAMRARRAPEARTRGGHGTLAWLLGGHGGPRHAENRACFARAARRSRAPRRACEHFDGSVVVCRAARGDTGSTRTGVAQSGDNPASVARGGTARN